MHWSSVHATLSFWAFQTVITYCCEEMHERNYDCTDNSPKGSVCCLYLAQIGLGWAKACDIRVHSLCSAQKWLKFPSPPTSSVQNLSPPRFFLFPLPCKQAALQKKLSPYSDAGTGWRRTKRLGWRKMYSTYMSDISYMLCHPCRKNPTVFYIQVGKFRQYFASK